MKTLHLCTVLLFPVTCLCMNKVCFAKQSAVVACIQVQPWIDFLCDEVSMHPLKTTKKLKAIIGEEMGGILISEGQGI